MSATVAVIIPYYQTSPGILARAVASVLAQDPTPGTELKIVVVDDASPRPAEEDLRGLGPDAAARITVIRQPNGGPAAARNRGLEAAQAADFVAFLDSDDYWRPRHLAEALAALGEDCDFFFSDIDEGGGRTWFERSAFGRDLLASGAAARGEVARLSGEEARSLILKEHTTHASSVVYRRAAAAGLRFRTALRDAGEDHLFWIELAAAARCVAVGARANAGRHDDGVNMFTGALEWDHPGLVKILISVLRKYRVLEQEPGLAGADLPLVRERRRRSQDQLAFIILRAALRRPASLAPALGRLSESGARAGTWFLPAAARAVVARATGRFEIVF